MSEQEFLAGHVFFRPGDAGDQAYLLHHGQVEILAGTVEPLKRIGLMNAGDVFGDMVLIEERPRSLTARAVTAGRASPMTRDDFERLLTDDPKRIRQYLRSLFERLRSLTVQMGARAAVRPEAGPTAPSGPVEIPIPTGKAAEWAVVVHPLTRKAAETLPDEGLRATQFPLRIGRASAADEREALDLNDLWLLDVQPYNVSRNHCEIYIDPHDGPVVSDRGSHLGCGVNEERIGGRSRQGVATLEFGENVLVVGGGMSPYQFRIVVSRA